MSGERSRRRRWVLRSTDGGRHWEPCETFEGSIVWSAVKPGETYDDGYGNLYCEYEHGEPA